MSDFNISNISSIDETDRQSGEILNEHICSTNFLDDKTIVIYNPYGYCESCGGRTVLHYIGKLLKEKNINVKMYAGNESYDRPIFSDFITEYDPDKIIVIYPEITTFNPLNAKYVIRWILAPVGKNVGEGQIHLWDKNDLVYYFLSEEKMKNEPEKQNSIYKFLTTIYLKPNTFINYNRERKGYCHILKKALLFHKNGIETLHPPDSVELGNFPTHEALVEFFNRFEYFVCYDPCSFLVHLAGLCGCIPILHKVDGISKEQWFTGKGDTNSAYYEYYLTHEYTNFPGIAYGLEDIEYARSTIHLLPELLHKQIEYINAPSIEKFIIDMQNFESNINTVQNNYF
jgi:hypothetical protein